MRGLRPYDPQCPMLFLYGKVKPFMFHSRPWLERLGAHPTNRVVAFDTAHWIMVQDPLRFNDVLLGWLDTTSTVGASRAMPRRTPAMT